jgi:diketogulonate reductase-like aldo/keto reductase
VALAWVLRNPVVSSAIIGATSIAQLEQNCRALEVKLSDAEWREVGALTAVNAETKDKPIAKSKPRPVKKAVVKTMRKLAAKVRRR